MNNTITLSALINRLAKVADTDTNTSRRFLRTFFATIEDQLSAGESVTIKGIGTFRRSQDPTFGTPGALQFIPDEQLAAETNAPFAMFSAVELADGVSFKDTDEKTEEKTENVQDTETTAENTTVPEEPMKPIESEPVRIPAPEPEPEAQPEPAPAEEPVKEAEEEPAENPVAEPVVPRPQPQPATPSRTPLKWPEEEEAEEEDSLAERRIRKETRDYTDELEDETSGRHRFPWWFWLGIVLLLVGGAAAGYIAAMSEPSEYDEAVEEPLDSLNNIIEEVQVADLNAEENAAKAQNEIIPDAPAAQPSQTEAAPAPAAPKTAPEPAAKKPAGPVYDTVDVSLAKLAKKHYGNTNYWVFIYQANESNLGNPDHVARGTRVIIPAKETFQESTDSATKAKAAKLAGEIARKFKK